MRDSYGYLAADPHFMQVSWLMDYRFNFPSQVSPVSDNFRHQSKQSNYSGGSAQDFHLLPS